MATVSLGNVNKGERLRMRTVEIPRGAFTSVDVSVESWDESTECEVRVFLLWDDPESVRLAAIEAHRLGRELEALYDRLADNLKGEMVHERGPEREGGC